LWELFSLDPLCGKNFSWSILLVGIWHNNLKCNTLCYYMISPSNTIRNSFFFF
jgi:hypothetical protein